MASKILGKTGASKLNAKAGGIRVGASKIAAPQHKKDKDDPFRGIDYTGDPEKDTAAELSATLEAFKKANEQQELAFKTNTDTEFYTCLVFETVEQRDEFLKKVGAWSADDVDHRFIDGVDFARVLGHKLSPTPFKGVLPKRSADSRWVRFTKRGLV